MVTNYPQAITANRVASEPHQESVSVFDRLRQFMCGLHGHDSLLQFERERMFLRCVSCGHETPGWETNDVPPPVTAQVEHRHHAMARPQLISERRIA